MAKTFLPRLAYLLRRLCLYITRYGPKLRENLTSTGQELLDEVLETCAALVGEIDNPTGP